MPYLFSTPQQHTEMLEALGLEQIGQLFEQIPDQLKLDEPLAIPAGMTEMELESYIRECASRNEQASRAVCFQGGGFYDHFIPAVVDEIAARGEFYTAYTPYQAEASQGSLQAFFEYQTLICQLTGMDVSNASLYEGATAVSEGVFMAMRCTRRHDKVVVLGSLHPEYQQVLQTYLRHLECELVIVPTPAGVADVEAVERALDERTACLVIQHPNFFGALEETERLVSAAHACGALAVVSVDPVSLGLLQRPADYDADIVVAEGQSLGTPLQFGGPYLGILACQQKFVRQMPGRLIGETVDRNNKRCFVLNLQTREQHIRREKATSNICTNQGLLALRATIQLALLGRAGIREVAELCCRKARYAADALAQVDGLRLHFANPFFKEFVVHCRDGADVVRRKAQGAGFDLGPDLNRFPECRAAFGDEAGRLLLVAVTEQRTRAEIDRLVEALKR